jgi:hypothetical protein
MASGPLVKHALFLPLCQVIVTGIILRTKRLTGFRPVMVGSRRSAEMVRRTARPERTALRWTSLRCARCPVSESDQASGIDDPNVAGEMFQKRSGGAEVV